MKLIHTSDWHIGRSLYGRRRYEEFEAFLSWLVELIDAEQVDVLLVAGDVFDTSAPSNRAQELYYRFLYQVANSACRHVVITAGNHDSPSFLNAPREVLRFLNVHVVGNASASPGDEVLVLHDPEGKLNLWYARFLISDRDIRQAEAGETISDKERKLVEGIREHYRQVVEEAERIRARLDRPVPIVAMGHLFTAGGKTVEGDGVRDLYVGSLAYVGADVFPASIDYLALGHLHLPQRVGGLETMRYSGSPLPIGFGEAAQEKSVCQVVFSGTRPVVTEIPVPRFQELVSIKGDWNTIAARLDELRSHGSDAWLEITYEGDEIVGDLRERLDETVEGTGLEILRVQNNRVLQQAMMNFKCIETLDDLEDTDVFRRCLEAHEVPEVQRMELLQAYQEVVASLDDDDPNAE